MPISDLSPSNSFEQRMIEVLNAGALNLALAIGQRTGLFEVLAGFARHETAEVIAASAGLSERYVREWLGSMATGEILEVQRGEDGEERYLLPVDRIRYLTRAEGAPNLALYCRQIPLLTCCALEQVLAAMQTGNGIPQSNYPAFQELTAELADARHRQSLLSDFLPAIADGRLVERLAQGARVLNVGCGEGGALLLMAKAYPASRFVGIDIDWEALALARKGARRLGLENVEFVLRDAVEVGQTMNWQGQFDYVAAFDAIHDQPYPVQVLEVVRDLLAEDGWFSMVDTAAHSAPSDNLDHPLGTFLYTVSLMHSLPVGLAGGGAGLGLMWGRERACRLLEQAGFSKVTVEAMPGYSFRSHFLCRK